MVGRSSGQDPASHPSWYRKQRGFQQNRSYQSNFESPTVADAGSSFRPENFQSTKCVARPNKDFEFSTWVENVNHNATVPLNQSAIYNR